MATEEIPVSKESLDEKLGELKIEAPEEAKEAVLEELKESPPELHHVETKDTTDPVSEPTTEDGVVKAEVPEAFADELKSDHDIVPPAKETTSSTVETVAKETSPVAPGEDAPATKDIPVGVTHEEVETKHSAKGGSIGEKISATLHKLVGKE